MKIRTNGLRAIELLIIYEVIEHVQGAKSYPNEHRIDHEAFNILYI